MKRFSETAKWDDPWFRALAAPHKLVFLYIVDRCNNAGFWEIDEDGLLFQTKLHRDSFKGAIPALARGMVSHDGWVWIRRFLRHQKNEALNPSNPAHKQIIALIREQVDRFGGFPEFQDFVAPCKGLFSPIGTGNGIGNGQNTARENIPTLADAKAYGETIGCPTEWTEKFWNHFDAVGWVNKNGHIITNWKSALASWREREKAAQPKKKKDPNI